MWEQMGTERYRKRGEKERVEKGAVMDGTLITVSLEPWKRSQDSITKHCENTLKLDATMCPDGMSGSLRSRTKCPSLYHK